MAAAAQPAPARGPLQPIVRTIAPAAYGGNGAVWDMAQDRRGLLYAATSYGVRQYDGARWRDLPTGNQTTPWDLALGPDGALYAGARNTLGAYRLNAKGKRTYQPLIAHVPDAQRPVGNVRDVVATSRGAWFRTARGVLHWDGQQMKVVGDSTTQRLFRCRDTAYLQTAAGRLRPAARAPSAASVATAQLPSPVAAAGPAGADGCWIVTEAGTWHTLTRSALAHRTPPHAAGASSIQDVVQAPGGVWAVATDEVLYLHGPGGRQHRLRAFGPKGRARIEALHMSARGALWVATTNGLARVAWPSPLTKAAGLPHPEAQPRDVVQTATGLRVGTTEGVWNGWSAQAKRLTPAGVTYHLLPTAHGVLAAQSNGLFVIEGSATRRVMGASVYSLAAAPHRSTVAYAGARDGTVLRLRHRQGRWQLADTLGTVPAVPFTLSPDARGHVWVGTGHRGVHRFRMRPSGATYHAAFDTTNGLPATTFNYTTTIGDSVRFITRDGLYRYTGTRFVPDRRFAAVYRDSVRQGWPVAAGPQQQVWMDFGGHKLGVARGWPNAVTWHARAFRRMADLGDVHRISPTSAHTVWFATANTLMHYDRRLRAYGDHAAPFRTLLRGVVLPGDSLVWAGDAPAPARRLVLPFNQRLRFLFGATSYEQITGVLFNRSAARQYRWKLSGINDTWTPWTAEPRADFTSLPPGTFTLQVQARNLYNVIGHTARLTFTISPPWYRTWSAYAGYALLAMLLMSGLVMWRTRHLEQRQRVLEATIRERTAEVRAQRDALSTQKAQLERQTSQLAEQADALRALDEAKSRFFANLSHEFRTPLTLILGPVERVRAHLLEQAPALSPADAAEQLAMAERNAHRLLHMVQQLLDLARHDAGTLQLRAQPTDVNATVADITQAFAPLAERQQLTLTVDATQPPTDAPPVYLDPALFDQLLGNLLSNAIKFTPPGGRIVVHVGHTTEAVTLRVQDTGIGIPADKQAHIFDRFTQADDAATRPQEGAGIGLALTQTLVQLHGGTIAVDSTPHVGSTFTVVLPRGDAHLSEEQVAAPAEASPDAPTLSAPGPKATAEDKAPAESPAPTSSSTASTTQHPADTPLVLVVDDNADLRAYVRSVLQPSFRIEEATSGTEGLAAAREHLPDVILADVMMPAMDGLAMTKRLRDAPATAALPIIMLTARAEVADEVEGLAAGATDYIVKPFDPKVLEMRVRGALAYQERLRRQLLQDLQDSPHNRTSAPAPPATDDASTTSNGPRPAQDNEPASFEAQMRAIIAQRLPDPAFGTNALADALGVSRSTLYRRARNAEAPSPAELIRTMRLERGAALLQDGAGSVSEVAYAVGFSSLSHFSRQFTDHFNQAPTDYAAPSVEEG